MTDAKPAQTLAYKLGDIEVIAVADGIRVAPVGEGFVLNAPLADVHKALAGYGMENGNFMSTFTPTVIRNGHKTYVVDTGMGVGASQAPGSTFGFLVRNLASIGIQPKDVDVVIISHFHGDHVNGLLMPDGSPTFPNAEVSVPEVEYNFWMSDDEMGRASPGRMQDLFKNNRRVFNPLKDRTATHKWDKEVGPGITAQGTPGHSYGHTSYLVSSGKDSVYLIQDVLNHAVFSVRNPQWHLGFDQDPVKAEETRRKTLDMLAAEKLPIQSFHFPFPGRATIEKTGDGYREHIIS
jgi:glyoxylase-like metal-dependent hydrolase (beta-lactamase superfamily II)